MVGRWSTCWRSSISDGAIGARPEPLSRRQAPSGVRGSRSGSTSLANRATKYMFGALIGSKRSAITSPVNIAPSAMGSVSSSDKWGSTVWPTTRKVAVVRLAADADGVADVLADRVERRLAERDLVDGSRRASGDDGGTDRPVQRAEEPARGRATLDLHPLETDRRDGRERGVVHHRGVDIAARARRARLELGRSVRRSCPNPTRRAAASPRGGRGWSRTRAPR